MKKLTSSSVIVFTVALLAPQIAPAQGAITYLSNLSEPSTGSLAVGSNSWLAEPFFTGNNPSGYSLDSVKLAMTDASGNASGFITMIYALPSHPVPAPYRGSSVGTLDGSLNPATSGIYTYTNESSLTLLPGTQYFVVLAAGTSIANGAYEWSITNTNTYNSSGSWSIEDYTWTSSDGSSWNSIGFSFPQFAINATAIPEPSSEILLGLGGVFFGLVRWKAKSIA
jgi:hypothetical protein